MKYLIAAIFAPTLAFADYSTHKYVELYAEADCTAVLSVIDRDISYSEPSFNEIIRSVTEQGAIWGFLLGYDTASGGLHPDGETTLQAFRKLCAESPNRTALEILERMR